MRSRTALLSIAAALPAAIALALPLAAHATGVPFTGPIVPADAQQCAAGWGQLIQIINNLIAFALTLLLLYVLPFMIAWAGFLYVFSPANPANRTRANRILTNTAIGVGVALGAWLIVNTLLTALTTGSVATFTDSIFYNTSGDCILSPSQLNTLNQASQAANTTTLGSCPDGSISSGTSCQTCTIGGCDYSLAYGYTCGGGGTYDQSTGQCQVCTSGPEGGCTTEAPISTFATNSGTYGVSGAQCASDNTACSVSALQSAGLSAGQAGALSCIAVTESSGNPNTLPYNIAHPTSNSTACGTFQIVQTTWKGYASGSCTDFSNCTNANCNLQVATALVQNHGFSDWTCATCNSKAQSCINTYASGT